MDAIRLHQVIEKDGELVVTDLPCKKGEAVEVIIRTPSEADTSPTMTAKQLHQSGLVGLWKDRQDIQTSEHYARELREQAQRRE